MKMMTELWSRRWGRVVGSKTRRRLARWLLSGVAFLGINAALLYLCVELIGLSVPVATLFAAEICTLLRFFVNHYWVFGLRYPTLKGCLRFHVANVAAFGTWLALANALVYIGVHYQLAAIAAQVIATLLRLAIDFLWIWRHPMSCYREERNVGIGV